MDDTAQLQHILNGGGDITIPPGTYAIDATEGLHVRSNTVLNLNDVVLAANPTHKDKYRILHIGSVVNVTINRGTIRGERDRHSGSTGEWGQGVWIEGNAENIRLNSMLSTMCWGDGYYINNAKGVTMELCVADKNRRNGLSVISVNGLNVKGGAYKNTNGTRPFAGIDIEPDKGSVGVYHVTINAVSLLNNKGAGIEIAAKRAPVQDVVVGSTCKFQGNAHTIKSSTFSWWEKALSGAGVYNPTSIRIA